MGWDTSRFGCTRAGDRRPWFSRIADPWWSGRRRNRTAMRSPSTISTTTPNGSPTCRCPALVPGHRRRLRPSVAALALRPHVPRTRACLRLPGQHLEHGQQGRGGERGLRGQGGAGQRDAHRDAHADIDNDALKPRIDGSVGPRVRATNGAVKSESSTARNGRGTTAATRLCRRSAV